MIFKYKHLIYGMIFTKVFLGMNINSIDGSLTCRIDILADFAGLYLINSALIILSYQYESFRNAYKAGLILIPLSFFHLFKTSIPILELLTALAHIIEWILFAFYINQIYNGYIEIPKGIKSLGLLEELQRAKVLILILLAIEFILESSFLLPSLVSVQIVVAIVNLITITCFLTIWTWSTFKINSYVLNMSKNN